MTATDERAGTRLRSFARNGTRMRTVRRHEAAVIQAEVRRLARALSPAGDVGAARRLGAELRACREPVPRVTAAGSD
jgi:hypothetical protein